uniref:AAA+ ATPase domain-containing protein n=1 Tax=Tetradesmus obliquus TaxID=3088 RepID=A0A383WCV6_TETOB|eukprot:jgi/Sobl393_1/115/SZX74854.1
MSFTRMSKQYRAWVFASAAAGAAAAGAAAAGLAPVALADKKDDNFFDPEALERGAKALREINKSPYAKQALELQRQQEVTKQAEAKTKEAEFKAQASAYAKEQEAIRWEEQRKTMSEEAQRQAQLAQYNDELARKRQQAEHELQRQRNGEMVSLQEQAAARKEAERLRIEQQIQAERRAADQYAADLQKEVERSKSLAEAEGRIKENRENEDVNRRAALLKYQEETRKAIESINAVMSHLGAAAVDLLTDTNKLLMLVAGGSALALGVYGAREGARVAGKAAERWLGTPKLVRETSRLALIRGPQNLLPVAAKKTLDQVKRDFSDIILPGQLHDRVRALAATAANTKLHGAPYRHMLFYGPPGTGKTMAAKRLARTSGMDYAILSGGDVAPLGGGAVTQLHSTFDWAERSRKGLLLFIDEADAFLGRRNDAMSEGLRGALNALLFRTGDQSRDFMVVLATNRPGDLDDAVIDRMDEAIHFDLPGREQRSKLLALYLDKYISKAGTEQGEAGSGKAGGLGQRLSMMLRGRKLAADRIAVDAGVSQALLDDAARQMEGFSGREIAKFMASVQAAVYGSAQAVLTPEIFKRVLQAKLQEHAARKSFLLGHHGTGDSVQAAVDAASKSK